MPDEFLEKVAALRQADECERLERLSQLRAEDRARLENQRLRREKVTTKLHNMIILAIFAPMQKGLVTECSSWQFLFNCSK